MNRRPLQLTLIALATLTAGCGGQESGNAPAAARKTPVTVAQATLQRVEAIETTVGRVESMEAPALAAETSGRLIRRGRGILPPQRKDLLRTFNTER